MSGARLHAVNIGAARAVAAKSGLSGIDKRPATGPVEIGGEGLQGDTIVDRAHHGGADQAVYAYGLADYAWWEGELGRPLPPGTFGENLTLEGLASADFALGDRLEIGEVLLEVTSPRVPCATLEAHMGQAGFGAAFLKAGRPGPYFRVLNPGRVSAGDAVRHRPFPGRRFPIAGFTHPGWARGLGAADREAIRAARPHHRMGQALDDEPSAGGSQSSMALPSGSWMRAKRP